ncbi:adenylate/guanylate cyclase domain-containing protein [Undibacterium fentianense]|uniref:Adenylate/guanylate cyclase domain-containing protein n=1 Tax=Undibacterium fentianense TaxID=2828728 RepID=A0A941E3Q7_9BURK|nr:adenylate/guanylate cyclase domain-containing protein [Undibacterium fentianense]MBR7800632.1 adenylate/guanylate cyclase domain-containing protein [Undibacterium fentianense]
MKSTGRFIHLFSLLFLLIATVEISTFQFLASNDARLSDFLVRQHAKKLQADTDIVIINIDDASLARMHNQVGNWPWPRSVHAELLDGIARQAPRAIVFDLTFEQKDLYRPESDARFNESLHHLQQQGLPIFFPMIRRPIENDLDGDLLVEIAPLLGLTASSQRLANARAAFEPPRAIDQSLWQVGTINFRKDRDGVGRSYDLYTNVYGWLAPSLPAKVAEKLGYLVPKQDSILLSWRGERNPFRRISYVDLYEDFERQSSTRPSNELKDKILIIGTDASALHDIRVTPIDSLYSGLDILATSIDNLKNQRSMQTPPIWINLFACVLCIIAVYLSFLARINALYPGFVLTGISVIALVGSYIALSSLWLVHIVTPLALVWTYYFSLALRAYWLELRKRQKTEEMFSRFVNPHVVKELGKNEDWGQQGQSREITILFSDIRGFTTLCENRTPQEIVDVLNRYFTRQVAVVFKHNGAVDKFIGDCIMAFWGAPIDNPAHALNAVQAAMEMAEVLQEFKQELGVAGTLAGDFDVGIGIHSGPAVVGFIGSEERKEFTVIGDTVNLASRIEGLTKGVSRILVSRETMLLCEGQLHFQPLGSYKVKGREQEVELFAPISSH